MRVFSVLIAFIILLPPSWSQSVVSNAPSAGEYYFNTDPGEGLGISIPILPETGSDPIEFAIPGSVIEALDPGIHSLSIRWADDVGVWGIPATIFIYRVEDSNLPEDKSLMTLEWEWWIGDDHASRQTGEPIIVDPAVLQTSRLIHLGPGPDLIAGTQVTFRTWWRNAEGEIGFPETFTTEILPNTEPEVAKIPLVTVTEDTPFQGALSSATTSPDIVDHSINVAATSENYQNVGGAFRAIDDSIGTEYIHLDGEGSGFLVELNAPRLIRNLDLVGGNEEATRSPTSWRLEGSHDGFSYEDIDEGLVSFPPQLQSQIIPVDAEEPFLFYRLTFPTLPAEANAMVITEVQLLAYDDMLWNATITAEAGNTPIERIHDRFMESNFVSRGEPSIEVTVIPDESFRDFIAKGMTLVWDGDAFERDRRIIVEGSNDNGISWVEIYRREEAGDPDAYRTLKLDPHDFSGNQNTYGRFRVRLNLSPDSSIPLVINEIQLLGIEKSEPVQDHYDKDGDMITFSKVSDPSHGLVVVNPDGSFTYTPNANYEGPDSFTIKANDGYIDSEITTINLIVARVNDPPTLAEVDALTTAEDEPVTGQLNTSDIDNEVFTYPIVDEPNNGVVMINEDGSFTYTPDLDFYGNDSFVVKANDGGLDSNTVTIGITITAVNDPPNIEPLSELTIAEDTALSGTLSATDVEGDDLIFRENSDPENGSTVVDSDGGFTYTPSPDFNRTDSFSVVANDGLLDSEIVTIEIVISPVNDPPVLHSVDELTVPESGVLRGSLSAEDIDGDALTYHVVSPTTNGVLVVEEDGSFRYAPARGFFGSEEFTAMSSDGTSDSNVETVRIVVTPVNDPPIMDAMPLQTVEQDHVLEGSFAAIDEDGDPVGFRKVEDPSNGVSSVSENGLFTYTPSPGFHGNDSFRVVANDGMLDSNIVVIDVVVTPTEEPLTLIESWREEYFGTSESSGLAADLVDPEKDGLLNLVEFAFGLNPLKSDANALPDWEWTGVGFELHFTSPEGVAEDIVFVAEWSSDPSSGNWQSVEDSGEGASHAFVIPRGTHSQMFVRIRVALR